MVDLALLESNKKRIDDLMVFTTTLRICPNCGYHIYPKIVEYKTMGCSNLFWCNHCYKGKAACFWKIAFE